MDRIASILCSAFLICLLCYGLARMLDFSGGDVGLVWGVSNNPFPIGMILLLGGIAFAIYASFPD